MLSYSNISLWYSEGRLHTIIGFQPGTQGAKLKEACKLARLRTHPDKGGDAAVFKIVEETVKYFSMIYQKLRIISLSGLIDFVSKIDCCRLAFDRGCGDIEQMQRLRAEYKRNFHEHQRVEEEEEARREQKAREEREYQAFVDRLNKDEED